LVQVKQFEDNQVNSSSKVNESIAVSSDLNLTAIKVKVINDSSSKLDEELIFVKINKTEVANNS